jgi:hypothetical protein
MSEGLREYDFNFDAANELEEQAHNARELLEHLALHFAANEPLSGRPSRHLVLAEHVRRAAEFLFRIPYSPGRSEESPDPIVPPIASSRPVFVSFSFNDKSFVAELSEKLNERGLAYFVADRDSKPTANWAENIWDAIRGCKVFLPVITPRFLNSHWFHIEAGAACVSRKPVLPILRYVEASQVPSPLDQFQMRVVENSRQLDDLIKAVEALCV